MARPRSTTSGTAASRLPSAASPGKGPASVALDEALVLAGEMDLPDDPELDEADAAMASGPQGHDEVRDWVVPVASHGQRLDAFLAGQVTVYSRSHLKTLVEEGCVAVAGQPITTPSRKVLAGQHVEV